MAKRAPKVKFGGITPALPLKTPAKPPVPGAGAMPKAAPGGLAVKKPRTVGSRKQGSASATAKRLAGVKL